MGESSDWYVRAPMPLVLLLGPLMGLFFFFTLPLSGMVVLVPFLARKVRMAVSAGSLSPAHFASGAQPGVSYLEPRLRSGSGEVETEPRDGPEPGKLVDISERIAEKDQLGN